MYWESLHGPTSDNNNPPSASLTSDLPPNLTGKFSAGICLSKSDLYELPKMKIFETVTGSKNGLNNLKAVENPNGALMR